MDTAMGTAGAGSSGAGRGWGWAALGLILLALVLRLWALPHDLPFSYYGDELHFMKRSMALGSGDLNPHWFHKPALLMYVLLGCYGSYFLCGRLVGRFISMDHFAASFLTDYGPFLLIGRTVVMLTGVGAVWVTYLLGRRLWGDPRAGLAGGLVSAVITAMVASSQEIKADMPSALLVTLALWVYLGSFERPGWKPLVLASLLAGAAMGTKYYGIILVPTFLLGELGRAALDPASGRLRGLAWKSWLTRSLAVGLLFVAGFFVTSPYNFLDATWGRSLAHRLSATSGLEEEVVLFDPDSKVTFQPGPAAWGAAAVHFLGKLTQPTVLGPVLPWLIAAGWVAALLRRRTRLAALVLGVPPAIFLLAAVTVAAFHTNARHLTATLPILATFAWPGALAVTTLLRRLLPVSAGDTRGALPPRWRTAALVLVALALLPNLARTVAFDRERMLADSRTVAYRWVMEHLPKDQGILVEDYGPTLQPGPAAIARQRALLEELPPGPFLYPQRVRLDLLERFPPADGLEIEELGHQWWLPAEKSDEELRSDETDMDMGNPLISRQPRTAEEYRRRGIRYVVTNDSPEGRGRILGSADTQGAWPSFVAFYRSLEKLEPIHTIDPAEWGGHGPIIRVYDLGELDGGTEGAPAGERGG